MMPNKKPSAQWQKVFYNKGQKGGLSETGS
jgi:hypothetical protein